MDTFVLWMFLFFYATWPFWAFVGAVFLIFWMLDLI